MLHHGKLYVRIYLSLVCSWYVFNFDNVFFFFKKKADEGGVDPNITLSGPSSARQRNAIIMAFRWRVDDENTLNSGLAAL